MFCTGLNIFTQYPFRALQVLAVVLVVLIAVFTANRQRKGAAAQGAVNNSFDSPVEQSGLSLPCLGSFPHIIPSCVVHGVIYIYTHLASIPCVKYIG